MATDPRTRNKIFNKSSIHNYLIEYAINIRRALCLISEEELEKAKELLALTLASGGRIFVGGNGGSAAISDHLCCDFVKGTYSDKARNLTVHSLVASQALFTAIGNDFGYEHTLSFQLEAYNVNAKDLVILISSSGNSTNIIKAVTAAQARGAKVIGLSGFSGGELKRLANVSLHIDVNNYGVVEDCHQAIMHVLAQFHYLSFNE